MVKADCHNPSHGGSLARLTGEKGIDACVRCCGDIRPVCAELPPEPTHREWETTKWGPTYTLRVLRNQGIIYIP
jgi:hypothetical protein